MRYLYIYFVSFIITEILSYLITRLHWGESFKDSTFFRKEQVLLIGGTIHFFSILISAMAAVYIFKFELDYIFIFILSAGFFIMLIGLFEDLKKIDKFKRYFLEFLVFIIIILLDIKIKFLVLPGGKLIFLKPFYSFIVTLIWFFFITNFLSWFYELEGFISGAVSISLIGILLLMKLQGNINQPVILMNVIVLGTLLSIFRNEFFPAKILTGRSGSIFLGFLLGILSLLGYTKLSTMFLVFFPIVLIFIFIFIFIVIIIISYIKGTLVTGLDSLVFHGSLKINYVLAFIFFLYFLTVSTYLILWYYKISIQFILLSMLLEVLVFTLIAFFILRKKKKKLYMYPPDVSILNVKINNVDYNETLDQVIKTIDEGRRGYIITANSLMVMNGINNILFKRILNDASIVTPDGIGLIWASNFLGTPLKTRVTGIDLTRRLLRLAALKGYSVYLLGGSPGITIKVKMDLEEGYPGIKIAGVSHGYFSKREEVLLIEEIRRAQPDLIFVGFGSPNQEKWINRNFHAFDKGILIGVGGSFDVLSGQIKRAPNFLQRVGLEWFFRLLKEPYRWKRMLALPKFIWYIFIQRMLNDAEE
ncbi:MAG: WecB/TagA/CpsF family glycosyltransferase [bacterium]|nr:WecB/TagA/CpsF family glycosyltransferase [bacterium]